MLAGKYWIKGWANTSDCEGLEEKCDEPSPGYATSLLSPIIHHTLWDETQFKLDIYLRSQI